MRLDGEWKGDLGLKAQPGQDPSVVSSLSRIKLNFTGSNQFELLYQSIKYSGTVITREKDADLVVETVINHPVGKDLKFKITPVGDTLEFVGAGGDKATLTPVVH